MVSTALISIGLPTKSLFRQHNLQAISARPQHDILWFTGNIHVSSIRLLITHTIGRQWSSCWTCSNLTMYETLRESIFCDGTGTGSGEASGIRDISLVYRFRRNIAGQDGERSRCV